MAPEPITRSALGLDLSPRVASTTAVAASPALAAETVIATLTIGEDVAIASGIDLVGFAAFTVGTAGVSVNLRIRETDTSGTVVATTGATTATAADLGSLTVAGFDTAAVLPGQVYVLTMQVASASAESTVSAVSLRALIV